MNRSVIRGLMLITFVIMLIVVMIFLPGEKNRNAAKPNNDPWQLVSYDPNDRYGTYLANGFISTRMHTDGVGHWNGHALPCYMAGFYNKEKLVRTPTWSDLRFYDEDGAEFRIDKEADYKQTLNMKTGVFTTEATWRSNRKRLQGKIEVIVSRARPNIALLRADLIPSFNGAITTSAPVGGLHDGLELISSSKDAWAFRTTESKIALGLSGAVDVVGVSNVKNGIMSYSSSGSLPKAQSATFDVKNDEPFAVVRYVSIATGVNTKSALETARAELAKVRNKHDETVAEHKKAWARIWRKDITIDGPAKDQQALHSCMFYLLQSVREGSQWSIPPMGLSGDAFSGHVFWDADIWIFPALILQHPELARSIVDYRYNTLPGAIANAKEDGYAGAQYAWESGFTGREDTPPGLIYRFERHINGDVALAQWQYYLATGDDEWLKLRGYPVLKATADYWVSRVKFSEEKDRYEIHLVVPPDENAEVVNNSVYTNAIAKMNLQIATRAAEIIGEHPNSRWSEVASKMYIPFDEKNNRFIAHDNARDILAKQADAELLAYPLQFVLDGCDMESIYKNTYDYYSSRVHKNGPAMTSSAHSVISARLGDCEQAYRKFVESYEPFFRGGFNYFNEKPSKTYEMMCFLTGAAGPVQAALFGLAGAQIDYFPEDIDSQELTFSPCLPEQWKSMKITGVQWRGKTFDVSIMKGNEVEVHPARS